MRSDWSSPKAGLSEATALLVTAFESIISAGRSMAWSTWGLLGWSVGVLWSLAVAGYQKTRSAFTGPVKEFVLGPLHTTLLGTRRDISIFITLASPVISLLTAWWVGSTVGFGTVADWVRGTWFGTDPSLAIFLAVGGLLALGTLSAGLNSGLLPTGLLVSSPIFGAAVTRYATTITYTWGSEVVSLPDAMGVALLIAVGFGIPFTLVGFVLGRTLRQAARAFGVRNRLFDSTGNA